MEAHDPNSEWNGDENDTPETDAPPVAVETEQKPEPAPQPAIPGATGTTVKSLWGGHSPVPQPTATHGYTQAAPNPKPESADTTNADAPIPSDYQGLIREHQRLYNLIPRTDNRAIAQKLRARHVKVKAKINALQNAPQPAAITATHLAEMAVLRQNAPASRAARLTVLEAALALPVGHAPEESQAGKSAEELDTDYHVNIAFLRIDPKQRLLDEAEIHSILTDAKRAACELEKFDLEHHDLLNPEVAISELELEISNSTDAASIRDLQSKLAGLKANNSATWEQNRGRNSGLKNERLSLHQDVLICVRQLISRCTAIINGWRVDAGVAETAFFQKFGLPHEPTQLQRRYVSLRDDLSRLTPSLQCLAWFGVKDVADMTE